ncbi:MAG: antibiotic biosynthesis monooxygenase [Rhodomicrobium sp.]
MFIAMNRFRVKRGSEADFEAAWLNRDIYINREPGFVAFHLLKGPQSEDFSLYVSHTIWESVQAFENWTRSESFRAAHRGAGENKPLYIGGPQFEGFQVIQDVQPAER